MTQTITISKTKFDALVRRLDKLEKLVLSYVKRKKVKKTEPPYGSKEWWEKEEKEADEDIKKGRVVRLESISDLDKSLEELFP